MTNSDNQLPEFDRPAETRPSVLEGWVVFIILLLMSAGAWVDPEKGIDGFEALLVQFFFMGAAWFLGSRYVDRF